MRKGFPERPASFNHLYTLDLYKNTKAESTITDTSGGYTVRIQVGYFISYGVHLEEFYPRDVPLKRLEDWIDRKEVKNVNARNLQRKLRVEPEVYPILDTTWNERAYSELYVEEALTRLRSVWFNA